MDKATQDRLIRLGAEAELVQLHARVRVLEGIVGRNPTPTSRPMKKRRKMSAATRKAVSLRMKKYWAEKRKKKS